MRRNNPFPQFQFRERAMRKTVYLWKTNAM
jgi:hypothetical protein